MLVADNTKNGRKRVKIREWIRTDEANLNNNKKTNIELLISNNRILGKNMKWNKKRYPI